MGADSGQAVIPPPPDGSAIVASGAIPPPPDGSGIVAAGGNKRTAMDSVGDFASELWKQISPKNALMGAVQATAHPIETFKNDAASRQQIYQQAEDSFKKGNYTEGAAHLLYSVLPLVGPQLNEAANNFLQGNYAKGAGASTGMGLALAAPELAGKGISAVKSGASKAALLGRTPQEAYLSALKPSTTLSEGERAAAAQTGLEQGIPVSKAGLEKIADGIDQLNTAIGAKIKQGIKPQPVAGYLPAAPTEIPLAKPMPGNMPGALLPAERPPLPESVFSPDARIKAGMSGLSPIRLTDATGPEEAFRYYTTSGRGEIAAAPRTEAGVLVTRNPALATKSFAGGYGNISPTDVVKRLDNLKAKFATQVNPEGDLAAIEAAKQEFLRNNPDLIPATKAQAMKQGTYRSLGDKSYGEIKSASVEAQKSLARGLKEEIANQFPEISGLNDAESKLLNLQPLMERAVARIGNHQLMGIGTPITVGATKAVTGSGSLAAVAGLVKAVLDDPAIKSRLAIAIHKGSKGAVSQAQAMSRIQGYGYALSQAASPANAAPQADQSTQ